MKRLKKIIIGFLVISALGIAMTVIDYLFHITYENSVIEISYKVLTGFCLIGCSYTGKWMLENSK